jgi:hypothetical protein
VYRRTSIFRWISLLAIVAAAGCSSEPPESDVLISERPAASSSASQAPPESARADASPPPAEPATTADPAPEAQAAEQTPPPVDRPVYDADRLAAAGVRSIAGKHLTLYTDLAPDAEIDQLPAVFDLAAPQWAEYFGVPVASLDDWRVDAFLMADRERFVALEMLPAELPAFRHGLAQADHFWLNEQPTPYYRRHLFLHEGTHLFMMRWLGSLGPPWYAEGMAELFATHQLEDGRLALRHMPSHPDEVPRLGRIKMIQDAVLQRRALPLDRVLAYSDTAHQEDEAYAWCWALAALLDAHPRYQERFRALPAALAGRRGAAAVTRRVRDVYAADWGDLAEEWQNMIVTLDHGHDLARTAINLAPGRPLADLAAGEAGLTVHVTAERGWINSGLLLEAGRTYRIEAEGRCQIAADPRIWWSEPGGVTIRYLRGQPLGMLLAAVRPVDDSEAGPSPFIAPLSIGLGRTITPEKSGTLFFLINDSPGELDDNAGEYVARILPPS